MQWAGSFSLVGHAAIDSLKDVYMDRVFVSVCGIDLARGITVIEGTAKLAAVGLRSARGLPEHFARAGGAQCAHLGVHALPVR